MAKTKFVSGVNNAMNPMRFMQIALGIIMFFSIIYMGQFISRSSPNTIHSSISIQKEDDPHLRIDQPTPFPIVTETLLKEKKFLFQGFKAGFEFVKNYNVAVQGPLYILFMSDADANGNYWCPDCQRAKKPVYDVFARTKPGTRLVEIRVGTPAEWKNEHNDFRYNKLFYIDNIPTLIKYEGGGNSSRMLIEEYELDYDLLEYVFDIQPPKAGLPHSNTILTLKSATQVQEKFLQHDHSYPLFIFFTSGFHPFNGRFWCPYCDRSEVPIMHYYNYTAPNNAVLIRAIVAPSYDEWNTKENPFRQQAFAEKVVKLRGVPCLGRVIRDPITKTNKLEEFTLEFSNKEALKKWFQYL